MKKILTLVMSAVLPMMAACGSQQSGIPVSFSASDYISDLFVGAGVQWSAYPHADTEDSEWGLLMTDEKWDELFRRVDYMCPRYMRVMDQANWRYFMKLDADGVPVLDFDNGQTRALFKILDYCESHNIVVMIGEWGVPGACHDIGNMDITLKGPGDPRWFEMIGAWVDYLLNVKKYTCIKYYDFINEPNGSWSCVAGDFGAWSDGVKMLHKEFEKRGLTDRIGICGPGSVPNANVPKYKAVWPGNKWTILAKEEVGDILAAYNTHAYYPHLCVRGGKAADYMFFSQDVPVAHNDGKPFFLGEIGLKAVKDGGAIAEEHERRRLAKGNASTDSNMFIYDYFYGLDITSAAIQSMNSGVDGMAVWDMDDAMHTKSDTGDIKQIKRWGFWNILGTELYNDPADENIRPWYWAWSWLGRYLPPQTHILRISPELPDGCQVLVGITPDKNVTVCAVNTSDDGTEIRLEGKGVSGRRTFNQLIYNEALYSDSEPPYGTAEVRGANLRKGFTFRLPAKTFTVLTTMEL